MKSPGVVVLPFTPPREYWNARDWYSSGVTAQQFLGDRLTNAGIPVVARGPELEAMTAEQVLDLSGSITHSVELGKKTGAQYILSGSVSSITRRQTGISLVKYTEAEVNVTVRLVDVERGIYLKTYDRTGKNRKLSPNLPMEVWGDSNVTDAIRKAVEVVATELVPYYQSLPRTPATAAAPAVAPAVPAASVNASKPWTVMVVIPETHLLRPKVPDPAAETEIVSKLITAGYRVFDQARVAAIRNERWVQELYDGTASPAQLASLKSRYGVDVVVTGEGISERVEAPARGGIVVCRGRVEIKAVFLESGEIMSSRDEQQGGQDLSEIMASKLALKRAGTLVAPKLIADLDAQCSRRCAGSDTAGAVGRSAPVRSTQIELEVAGWTSLSSARDFLSSLNALKGVVSARQTEYRAGILFAAVEVDGAAMKDLPLALEESAGLKRFRVAVQTAGKTKIEARVK